MTAGGRPIGGRLFGHRPGGGEVCTVAIEDRSLVAVAGDVRHELLLDDAELTFGGTDDDMLVVTVPGASGKLALYIPRNRIVADLRARGGAIAAHLADLEREHGRRRNWARIALAVIVVTLVLAVAGAFTAIDTVIVWGLGKVPPAWEVKLGRSIMGSMYPADKRVTDAAVLAAIDPIAARLLASLEPTGYEFEIHVIRDPQVNAFALPGGQIAVFTGLLGKCERPEELAGVLAHEIQHVERRHTLVRLGKALKWDIALSLVFGDLGAVERIMVGHAANLLSLRHDRDQERESDTRGLDLLYASRIDAEGMARFFEVLSEEEAKLPDVLTFLSTHPGGKERVATIRRLIAERGAPQSEPFDIDWTSVRTQIEEIKE